MILLECLHDQLRSRVLTDSLSHSPKPRMRIIVLLVCGQPSDVYISIGPLRRLIYYFFVDYPPMNINWAAPTIYIFNLDYPPIINIFRLPSDEYQLGHSDAIAPSLASRSCVAKPDHGYPKCTLVPPQRSHPCQPQSVPQSTT